MTRRVTVDGKQFVQGGRRFEFRGVTYGTFRPRADGHLFPDRERMKRDLAAMREADFTVVRTYTTPPDDLIDLADDWGLRILAGLFCIDWRYSVGCSRRGWRHVARDAEHAVRRDARRLADCETVLGVVIGNELPSDVVRWYGTERVERAVDRLVEAVRAEDDGHLVTYANFPTTEYFSLPSLDFTTFNVYLESPTDLRRYLSRLHHLAEDRPLVLGELGVPVTAEPGAEGEQARRLALQLDVALERGVAGTCIFSWTDDWWVGGAPVEDWRFGLTRRDRTPRPALAVATRANRRTVRDLDFDWPSISVVVCAYNAAATIDECLAHVCALDYPNLEVLVVDDGSTDATGDIVGRHPRARLVAMAHAGLSAARNRGMNEARGELVAYIDSDAYPTAEWPYYLALALDGPMVAGAGGPNLPPPGDGPAAQQVAHAPGGPVHVLIGDDRAEHVPGCNMAFWRDRLIEVGGFDPIFTSAGDDVDLCWKMIDRGWDIGFHPAAMVWHHRRTGLRAYLRQQRGYGRSEALVEARHPSRYNLIGSARWRGRVYRTSVAPSRGRVYRGPFGTAEYQSVYHADGHGLDVLHQACVPLAAAVALTAPLGFVAWALAIPAAAAALFVAALAAVDVWRATPPRRLRRHRLRFRLGVAAMHVLQPLVRHWGRRRAANAHETTPSVPVGLDRPARCGPVLVVRHDGPRDGLVIGLSAVIRRAGVRVVPSSGWDAFDARLTGSTFVSGDLLTSAFPEGLAQIRVRRRVRWAAAAVAGVAVGLTALVTPLGAALLAGVALAEGARGVWRTGPLVRRAVDAAAHAGEHGSVRSGAPR